MPYCYVLGGLPRQLALTPYAVSYFPGTMRRVIWRIDSECRSSAARRFLRKPCNHSPSQESEIAPASLPKSAGSPPLTRFQNRACAFPLTRLLSCVVLVRSTFNHFI